MNRLRWVAPAIFAVALFAVTAAVLASMRQSSVVSAVWPSSALVLAFLVRWPQSRAERWAVLGVSAAVLVLTDLLFSSTPLMAAAMVSLNILEVLAAAYVLSRIGSPMDSLKALGVFLALPVLLAPALGGACIALLAAATLSEPDLFGIFIRWFSAEGLGMAILTPLLLTIGRHGGAPLRGRVLLTFAVTQAAMLTASLVILLQDARPPLFMIFPFLVVAAMSHRQLGGVTAIVIASTIAVLATLAGRGPASVADLVSLDQVRLMQLFLATMVFAVLPISSLLRRLELYATELEERRARAEELNSIKSRLLAYVSHEIRSPMAGVTTLAAMMRDGAFGELNASQRQTLEQIAASGAEVSDLARDLTDASVLQSGKAAVRLDRVDAADAIRSAVNMARFRTSQYKAALEVEEGPADLRVAADPMRLRQILVNLLINGAKYGGRPPLVRIGAHATPDGMVRFEVSDNGPGIPEERRWALFQDFERLGAEDTELEGAGLGLALSSQIARLQHGELGVEDSDLGGVRFWLQLPAWSEEASAA